MQTLNFGSFVKTLFPYVKGEYFPSLNKFASFLLVAPEWSSVTPNDGPLEETASRFVKGTRSISQQYQNAFKNPSAKESIVRFLNDEGVIDLCLDSCRVDFLIEQLVTLIRCDTTIDQDAKETLIANANRDHLASFLADTLIFSITCVPFNTEAQLQQLAAPALTVLVSEAVPELIKTVLALFYAKYGESEQTRAALSRYDFLSYLQVLVEERRMTPIEYYRWKNILNIAGAAEKELESEMGEDADRRVDADFDIDWYVHFIESAGNISDKEMQRYWAKMIAGEIKRQGSFSRRTANVLAEMSTQEARLFKYVSSIAIIDINSQEREPRIIDTNKMRAPCNDSYILIEQILRRLVDCGLLSYAREESVLQYDTNEALLTNTNKQLVVAIRSKENISADQVPLPCYHFTKAGSELLSIMQASDDEYLFIVCNALKVEYGELLDVKVHRVIGDLDSRYGYLSDIMDINTDLMDGIRIVDLLNEKLHYAIHNGDALGLTKI